MQKLQVNAPVDMEDEEEDELTFDDVALAAFQGMLASGQFGDNIQAAANQAWIQAVPAFFQARAEFPEMMERIYGKPKA